MNAKYQGRPAMLVIAVFVGSMIYSGCYVYWKDFWLNLDGKQITATIIVEGLKPGAFVYEYEINGIQYNGDGFRGVNLDSNVHIGSKTLVFVSTSHPWLSSPQIPAFSLWRFLAVMAVCFYIEFSVVKALVKMHKPSNKSRGCVKTPARRE